MSLAPTNSSPPDVPTITPALPSAYLSTIVSPDVANCTPAVPVTSNISLTTALPDVLTDSPSTSFSLN